MTSGSERPCHSGTPDSLVPEAHLCHITTGKVHPDPGPHHVWKCRPEGCRQMYRSQELSSTQKRLLHHSLKRNRKQQAAAAAAAATADAGVIRGRVAKKSRPRKGQRLPAKNSHQQQQKQQQQKQKPSASLSAQLMARRDSHDSGYCSSNYSPLMLDGMGWDLLTTQPGQPIIEPPLLQCVSVPGPFPIASAPDVVPVPEAPPGTAHPGNVNFDWVSPIANMMEPTRVPLDVTTRQSIAPSDQQLLALLDEICAPFTPHHDVQVPVDERHALGFTDEDLMNMFINFD